MRCVAVLALLGGTLWVVYGRALEAPFVFDDSVSVVTNPSITRLWPLVGDAQHPSPLNPPSYSATAGRPVVNLTFALDYYFHGLDPAGYRFFNLTLHLMSAMLLWAIVRRTLRLEYFGDRFDGAVEMLSLAVALLWALHPLQTETIEYITQRTELMVGLWYLATLYCSLRYWAANDSRAQTAWLALATGACFAGMASKEVMVTAPLVVLLFHRTFLAGSFRASWHRSRSLYLGLFGSWLLLFFLNFNGPRSDSAGFHLGIPILDWWFNQATVLWMYVKLAIWPWPLVIHYELPQLEPLSKVWPSVVAAGALVAGVAWLVWRRQPAGFVGAASLLILAPTHLVPITTEVAAERRMYLPLAALVALAVVGGYSLARRAFCRPAADTRRSAGNRAAMALVAALSLVLAGVYGAVDAHRLAAYQDVIGLWRGTIAHQPHSHFAHHNLAVALSAAGHQREAIEHFRETLRLKPDFYAAHYCLGLELSRSGQFDEAMLCFQEAVRLKPDAYKFRNNLGVALVGAGRFDDAIAEFHWAIDLKPDMWEAYDNLGRALSQSGRPQEAIESYRQALRMNPDDLAIYANLAEAYSQANRPADAIATAQRALNLAQATGQTAGAQHLEAWLARHGAGAQNPPTTNP
jgi:tetratricopeptide (TPR) repeat protein